MRVPRPSHEQQALQLAEQRRARRVAIHQQVWELHHQGWSAAKYSASRLDAIHFDLFAMLALKRKEALSLTLQR
ncbi:hypothetical protein [uncultured Nostoc sp.]|uniref:hypothetical protein n=1 Tax=uncultured Nostoc sp. TaxID=340711 RepID=UPI0035C94CAE